MQALRSRLERCPADVPKLSFAGQSFYSRLYEVYDGDTVKIIIEFTGKWYHISCRLVGIDTPEINSKHAVEKAKAVRARNRIAHWALPRRFAVDGVYTKKEVKHALAGECVIIFVKCHEQDKYGRCLVELFRDEHERRSLNQQLVDEGFACAYGGGTKVTDWTV